MRFFHSTLATIATLIAVSSCTQKPAKIIYPQDMANYSDRIFIEEQESLPMIADKYNVLLSDLIAINKLSFPYKLEDGQTLILPPPKEYKVRGGDTVYSISRQFGVNLSELAAINNLSTPYHLNQGDILSLPNPIEVFGNKLVLVNPTIKQQPSDESTQLSRYAHQEAIVMPLPVFKERMQQIKAEEKQEFIKLKKKPITKTLAHSDGFIWPVDGKLLSAFGPQISGVYNDGINIAVNEGEEVKAAASGKVVYANNKLSGYGNLIIIQHAKGFMTAYAHNQHLHVSKGDYVEQGQNIATAGKTGNVKISQLHFGIRKNKQPVDPEKYLRHRG